MACLVCESDVEQFISFGRMPVANGFLTAAELASEEFPFELRVGFCPRCAMVQLLEFVDRERMFHGSYPFFSSTSTRMAEHFRQFADWTAGLVTSADPFIVEIGSNDGIMLRHFARRGWRHLGIEPSANVAAAAREQGVQTISEFFDEALAGRIVAEHGQADAFLGANVMCHIPFIHSVAAGVRVLLKPDGIFAFEDPYLGDIVDKTAYDQIYDEHAFYFSVTSVGRAFERHGLQVVDALPQAVHGGSMRYVLAHRGARPVAPSVIALLERERRAGLDQLSTFETFRSRTERSRDDLRALLQRLKGEGRRVVGYAATSKSTTVTNYCGLTPDLVEFIADSTPMKQGRFSPGAHIPIRSPEAFRTPFPDYALLFGWNHRDEIMAKEQAFRQSSGRWIVYVPRVEVVA